MKFRTFTYSPLWKVLADRQLPKTFLCSPENFEHISTATLAKLSRNESVTTETLLHICNTLDVELSDICATITNCDDLYNDLENTL